MNFITTCGAGLENLVGTEAESYQGQITRSGRGGIHWSGSLEAGYRACLWSRFGSRVALVLSEFEIDQGDDLYEASRSTRWEEHFSEHTSFAVDCVLSARGPVTNSMYGALRIKDGIADRFRELRGTRPEVKPKRPDIKVYLQVDGNRALLGLDLSGESLHRRGYRAAAGPAPLKENLAAAIIALSGWDTTTALLDPMCGSATLLLEAALMLADSAPGLGRTYHGFGGWSGHQAELWDRLVEEAIEREEMAQQRPWPDLVGYDGDKRAVRAAQQNIARAGFEDRIRVGQQEIHRLRNKLGPSGTLVCNPPYGERLSDTSSVQHLYRCLGERFQQEFPGWRISVFTGAPGFADQFRLEHPSSTKIFNGPLACRLFSGSSMARPEDSGLQDWRLNNGGGEKEIEELSNRLRKNFKKLHPWAISRRLDWYRLYDRDLPQYNVAIDLIGSVLWIREFGPPSLKDTQQADERVNQVIQTVRSMFGIGRDQVLVSRRRAGKVKSKKGPPRKKFQEMSEGEAVYLVDQFGDPATSFLPDQRFVRQLIRDHFRNAGSGSFLSLFDFGGAACVGAALGGADKTVSVGLARAQQQTAPLNYSRNGLHLANHQIAEEEVSSWLRTNRDSFSLILITLHSRKNSSRRSKGDGKSEHAPLVKAAAAHLEEGGQIILSTSIPSFRLDPSLVENYICKEISRKVSAPDLPRAGRNLKCWLISKK